MLALFLKSSTLPMQFALVNVEGDEVKLIDEIEDAALLNAQASKTLLFSIDGLLSKHGYQYQDLDAIYIASGPGSYTSARLLVAIVKTIYQLHKDLIVYDASLLDILLAMSPTQFRLAVVNARRRKYYVSGNLEGGAITPQLVDDEQLAVMIEQVDFINGVELRKTKLENEDIFTEKLNYQTWLAQSKKVEDIMLFEPYYLESVKIG